MSNYDKLNKLTNGSYKSPYSTVKVEEKKQNSFVPESKSILQSYPALIGKLRVMEDEIKNLKFDIVTLLHIITGDMSEMTIQEVRQYFSNFRGEDGYILQRIKNKKETIINNDLKFDIGTETKADI